MATPTVYVICDANCRWEGMTKEQILTAITQAVNEGTIGDIDTGFITTVKTINGTPLKFFVGAQNEYDALSDEAKQNLFAIITNDTTKEGIEAAIKELQESKTVFENVMTGNIPVPKAEADQKGRKIHETYFEASKYLQAHFSPIGGRGFCVGDEVLIGKPPEGKSLNDIVCGVLVYKYDTAIECPFFTTPFTDFEKLRFNGTRCNNVNGATTVSVDASIRIIDDGSALDGTMAFTINRVYETEVTANSNTTFFIREPHSGLSKDNYICLYFR